MARTHDELSRAKFGDCSFSSFGSITWTHTERQTDMNERFTPATVVLQVHLMNVEQQPAQPYLVTNGLIQTDLSHGGHLHL